MVKGVIKIDCIFAYWDQIDQSWPNWTNLVRSRVQVHLKARSSVVSLYRGKRPRTRSWDEICQTSYTNWLSIDQFWSIWTNPVQMIEGLIPIDCLFIDCHQIGCRLTFDLESISIRLVLNGLQIGSQWSLDWSSIGFRLVVDYHLIGIHLSSDWSSIVFKLVLNCL